MLSPLQKDALVEILNTHIGKAASSLSDMVNQKVILSVPEIELKISSDLNFYQFEKEGIFSNSEVVMSSIKFGNAFKGDANIVFPMLNVKELVNACMGIESEAGNTKLTNDDFDVIKEVCNVVLNALIGEFGNLLDVRLEYTSPKIDFALISSLEQSGIIPQNTYVLILYTSFFLAKSQVRGLILITLSEESVKLLLDKINTLLGDVKCLIG